MLDMRVSNRPLPPSIDVRACPRLPLSFLSSVLRSDAHLAWGVQLASQTGDDPVRLAVDQPQDTVSVALEA